MKNYMLKALALALALLVCVIGLAGCAGESNVQLEAPETEPTVQAAPSEETTAPTEETSKPTEETTAPTEEPTTAPTEAPTEPATAAPTEPATKPTEPKPTEPKPTEPKPTEPKPTEAKPTEPATQPTTAPTEAPKGVTEADFPELEQYARNYAKKLGFVVDTSLTYGNAGYYPATWIRSSSIEATKQDIRESVQSLKNQLLARPDTTEEMFDGTIIRYNCHLFFDDCGDLRQDDFYG